MRASRPAAVSSTQSRSSTNACSSRAAWATRSCCPLPPRTACWAARSRRSLTASTIPTSSASRATPAAASATMPCAELKSSTGGQASAPARGASRGLRSSGEDRRVLVLVVVGLLLAGDGLDLDRDRHVLPRRGLLVERDRGRLGLAGRDRGDALVALDGVLAASHCDVHRHVGLRVLALVLHLDGELEVRGELDRRRAARAERLAAERDRGEARAVQAWARLAARAPRAQAA